LSIAYLRRRFGQENFDGIAALSRAFEEGWFRTGNIGRADDEVYYYLTDRIKHIIISGGDNISPKEVESVIDQLKDVVESSVVGFSDEKWGKSGRCCRKKTRFASHCPWNSGFL